MAAPTAAWLATETAAAEDLGQGSVVAAAEAAEEMAAAVDRAKVRAAGATKSKGRAMTLA